MFKRLLIAAILLIAPLSRAQDIRHKAFNSVIAHEDNHLSGVVTREPFGGVARFGINSKANPQAIRDGFYTMPRQQALDYAYKIFIHRYWNPINGDSIESEALGIKLADFSFNMGSIRAIKLLQLALDDFGAGLVVDGKLGPLTMAALNTIGLDREFTVVYDLNQRAVEYYTRLCMKRHMMNSPWKQRWIERAES